MDWRGRTVLVTGAAGFIGSHLTERLVELGANTRALVRYTSTGTWGFLDSSTRKKDIQVFAGDVRDPGTLELAMKGVDTVFHLAALIAIPYSYEAPLSYVRTNIEGTVNVLNAARQVNARRVIHTSTSEVYGTARKVPIDEEHPLQGQSPYSASKIGADKLAQSFHLSFGQPVVTVRPFNTYGPRQSARAVIPTIITQCLTQPKIKLGALRPTRDFNFVADTVEGFIAAATVDAAIGETINLGSGREISIGDTAELIRKLMGKDIPVENASERERPANSEVERLLADASKAKRILGWTPAHTLEQGLQKTIEWIRANVDRYRPETYQR